MTEQVRAQVRVEGVVQGVGFRPFAYGLASRLGLSGFVSNDADGVLAEVEGPPAAVASFVTRVRDEAPPLAVVERVTEQPMAPTGGQGFTVAATTAGSERRTLVSPDMATCEDCMRELFDPTDRRYRYAFVNCTNCGPRFTIVRDVPYDRPTTTMAGFAMCPDCAREYDDPADRRFHAQPLCCPACGPSLRLVDSAGTSIPTPDAVATTARLLAGNAVVAVKGLGGYHVAALADSEPAVAALRSRKRREDKPFALMVPDLATAARLCVVTPAAERALTSRRRPVVLLPRRDLAGAEAVATSIASSVAPGNLNLGLLLPYTPLHHLLATELAAPFVLTSGNISDEPIAFTDDDALDRLAGIADAFLVHDRPIHIRTDDSVVRVVRGEEATLRRSRGYAPQPVTLASALTRPVLGCGAELKNTFCLAKGRHAFLSHHIGDLENAETFWSFTEGIDHFRRLFDIRPEIVAHDLHPEYLSTKYALDLALDDVELVGVQHHHAHVAACLADNGAPGPVIGVTFDGLGYGEDGTLWGGEFLIADLAGYARAGSFAQVPMPGGAAAVREPWRMAAAHLGAAFGAEVPRGLGVARRNATRWAAVASMAATGLNSPLTSSAGRLFDAVAALVGVRDVVNYEGQAAVELEQRAALVCGPEDVPGEIAPAPYRAGVEDGAPFRVQGADLVRAVVADVSAGVATPVVAARFHAGMATAIVDGCRRVRAASGLSTVALSGGVFQNVLLTGMAVRGLEDDGFTVLTHRRVPPNDGGISLGQVAVAGAREGVPVRNGR